MHDRGDEHSADDQRVDQDRQDFVARGQRQQPIEFHGVAQAFVVPPQTRHFFRRVDVAADRLDVGLGGPVAGEPHDAGLDQQARFGQVVERDGAEMDKVLDDARHAGRIAGADEGTALDALPELDDAGDFEAAQGLAQSAAADAELHGKLALRRELVARPQGADRELVTDALADLLEGAPAPDRLECQGLLDLGRRASQRGSHERLSRRPIIGSAALPACDFYIGRANVLFGMIAP